ncbi:MAG: hypothetical protein HY912_08285 [Desulfomonile tiedjei]|uniref:Uncharacterized protein n=1 Tax=Desulfomonile tiedjei TaxID=2358 RepID=A0A9D6Z3C7_9BACT|nr:hypothetical protein [Desulfomonile tiedjei]
MKNKVKARGTVEFQRAIGYLEKTLERLKTGTEVCTGPIPYLSFLEGSRSLPA